MKKSLLLLVSVVVVLASCNFIGGKRIKGNGNVVTEPRSVGNFSGVRTSGSYDLYVSPGPNAVKIEAEENILPYIETYLDGDILRIGTKDGIWLRNRRPVKIYVTAPNFRVIHSSGSGNIVGQGLITDSSRIDVGVSGSANIKLELDAPEIETSITGSGDADLKGQAKKFRGEISGSGNIRAMDLKTEETTIKISGSGNAEVYASVKLDVRVAGSGDVRYKGNAQVNSNIAGGGGVKKVD